MTVVKFPSSMIAQTLAPGLYAAVLFLLSSIAVAETAKALSTAAVDDANVDMSEAFAEVEKIITARVSNAEDIELVKDSDIADWIDFELQVDPQASAQWQQLDTKARRARIDEVRAFYVKMGVDITVPSNMTSVERKQMLFIVQVHHVKVKKLNAARELMGSFGSAQFRQIKTSCGRLLNQYQNVRSYRNIEVPDDLTFVDPDLLRIQGNRCVIFLQRHVGRGYGLEVKQTDQGLKLFRFDEFESWERTEIVD